MRVVVGADLGSGVEVVECLFGGCVDVGQRDGEAYAVGLGVSIAAAGKGGY